MRSSLVFAAVAGAASSACSIGLGEDCLKHYRRHLQEVLDVATQPDM